jgi:hypothetical protein
VGGEGGRGKGGEMTQTVYAHLNKCIIKKKRKQKGVKKKTFLFA